MSRSEAVAEYMVDRMPAMLEELRDLVIPGFEWRVAAAGRKAIDPSSFVEWVERSFADEVTMFFHDIAVAVDRKVCAMSRIDYANEEIALELHDNRGDPCTVLISASEAIAPVKAAITLVAKQHIAASRPHHRRRVANINV